ncbi:MAG TPA: SemiSWEET family transporter [Polyangiaceae bacterium]|nr:SemiSWEET family transporter [Polyangiaceae bacterium]
MLTEIIGWVSSVVLLATIVQQIKKQYETRSGKGVSRWLFIGQTAASVGFTAYSALLENWVFTVTNALMLVSAIVGWAITAHFKKHPASAAEES